MHKSQKTSHGQTSASIMNLPIPPIPVPCVTSSTNETSLQGYDMRLFTTISSYLGWTGTLYESSQTCASLSDEACKSWMEVKGRLDKELAGIQEKQKELEDQKREIEEQQRLLCKDIESVTKSLQRGHDEAVKETTSYWQKFEEDFRIGITEMASNIRRDAQDIASFRTPSQAQNEAYAAQKYPLNQPEGDIFLYQVAELALAVCDGQPDAALEQREQNPREGSVEDVLSYRNPHTDNLDVDKDFSGNLSGPTTPTASLEAGVQDFSRDQAAKGSTWTYLEQQFLLSEVRTNPQIPADDLFNKFNAKFPGRRTVAAVTAHRRKMVKKKL
ncbi:hypothetical protein F5X99DRAFT_220543 [Biscogniauxia marginata]|nr:hypothetical protein F5X99DRAFT_220543 [Biscogniauxia marginata]